MLLTVVQEEKGGGGSSGIGINELSLESDDETNPVIANQTAESSG